MTKEVSNDFIDNRFICFSLGEEEFAIPLLTVKEVIAIPEFVDVPFTPPHFAGVINLRGQVISVIDLRHKFKITSSEDKENAVIICELGEINIGILVDKVNSVLNPKSEELSEKPKFDSNVKDEYVTNLYRKDKHIILFLDIAKVLNITDYDSVAKIQREFTEKKAS